MATKKRKILIFFLSLLLILCIPLGVTAVKGGLTPKTSSGGYYSKTLNRIDFTVTNTDFVLQKTKEGNETFLLSTQVTVRKCEPDFYAKIKSMEISGQKINYSLFDSKDGNSENCFPENLIIRDSENHSWSCDISYDAFYPTQAQAQLIIEYESGITLDTADEHRLTIPINITVIN